MLLLLNCDAILNINSYTDITVISGYRLRKDLRHFEIRLICVCPSYRINAIVSKQLPSGLIMCNSEHSVDHLDSTVRAGYLV